MSAAQGIQIEEAAFRAWPASQQIVLGGWVVRSAGGYTKRANCATPLYPTHLSSAETLAACERHYADLGLPCIVRQLDIAAPPGLDGLLQERGYRLLDPSLVLARALEPWDEADGSAGMPPGSPHQDVDAFLDAYYRFSATPAGTRAAHRAIVAAITAGRALFELRADGVVVACGMGVLDGGLFGLFDIVTAPAERGRGHGGALVGAMLAWARRAGAARAYLQVVEQNAAARRLYSRLGFVQQHRYWYRARS